MSSLERIRNFLCVDDRLATSGMPKPDDFAALRQTGCGVVIKLPLPPSNNSLPNKGKLSFAQDNQFTHAK